MGVLGHAAEAFLLLGASVLAGFVGHAVFRRFRVSDVLVLLAIGFALGPGLGLVDVSWLAPAMPILAPLGLVIILFEGGLELRWDELRRHGWGAVGFSLLSWVASVGALYAGARVALGIPPHLALLFAVAVGATGIVAVIPMLAQLRAPAKARVWLTAETGIGDLLSAVGVVALSSLFLFGGTPATFGALLGARVALGAAVGFLAGLAWARALFHVRERAHAYALTLGALLVAYAATEWLGGSGLLAALVFGLVVGNASPLVREGGVPALATLTERSRHQQGEIIFLLRSLYFVYLGASLGRDMLTWAHALAMLVMTGALVAARLAVVALAHRGDRDTRVLLAGMMPRAMAAVVLASMPAAMGVPGAEGFVAAALLVVVGSDVATSIGIYVYERRRVRVAGDAAPAASLS